MIDIFSFWGKAQPKEPNQNPSWHPLVFHSLDVAAVCHTLLHGDKRLRARLASLIGLEQSLAVRLFCYMIALHDIGKFAKKFQAKVPERLPTLFNTDQQSLNTSFDHADGGLRLYDANPVIFGLPGETDWRTLIVAVTGHHGSPPHGHRGGNEIGLRPDFGKVGIEAAHKFIEQVKILFDIPSSIPKIQFSQIQQTSFALAGLAVLSDWLGSNQLWFPYRDSDQDLREYWGTAKKLAQSAVEKAGVIPTESCTNLDYDDLIDSSNVVLSPMQKWAQSIELPSGPSLFIIEDETGSGKTEAALMIVHRLMSAKRGDGVYFALPTMATANAMFDRLGTVYRRLFSLRSQPSIALVHSSNKLLEGFRDSIKHTDFEEANYSRDSGSLEESSSEVTASTMCTAWIADDRRRAFFADIGAGTIDQAVLSILPTRHQSLRLLGLMRRILVLDEVHAYDAYMQTEIESLIEFQAGLGGSTILLSATLPRSIRKRLISAFNRGLGLEESKVETPRDYPLATISSEVGTTFKPIAGKPDRARKVALKFIRSKDAALPMIERAIDEDQSVLYIRNTVDDAIDAYRELKQRGQNVQLFHARFALSDRLSIEKKVVKWFGKASRSEDRKGRVLVATQVVEQSLDLDFDTIVSDLAPIDLIIQRAGRLWRHKRAGRKGSPTLYIVGPEAIDEPNENWYAEFFPRAAYVYQNHALLWATARVLEQKNEIDSPLDIPSLIEAVYGDEIRANLPEGLEQNYWQWEGKTKAERGIGKLNTLDFRKGYIRDGGAWDADYRTPTRISDQEYVTLRLARHVKSQIEPYANIEQELDGWRAWRLSELNVAERRVRNLETPQHYTQTVSRTKREWSRYDREKMLVILTKSESSVNRPWKCELIDKNSNGEISLRYSSDIGLEFS